MSVSESMKRLVLLGAPGSGKGTQAELLAPRLGIPAISTGEMLRSAVETGSELGRRVQSIMASGNLVVDETMAKVVRERLARDDAAAGFVLDGYPRTLSQADTLAEIIDAAGCQLDAVVQIDVDEQELVQRILGRHRGADDREEVIRQRLDVYREQTEPLMGYYQRLDLLRVVDGNRSIEAVAEVVWKTVGGVA